MTEKPKGPQGPIGVAVHGGGATIRGGVLIGNGTNSTGIYIGPAPEGTIPPAPSLVEDFYIDQSGAAPQQSNAAPEAPQQGFLRRNRDSLIVGLILVAVTGGLAAVGLG